MTYGVGDLLHFNRPFRSVVEFHPHKALLYRGVKTIILAGVQVCVHVRFQHCRRGARVTDACTLLTQRARYLRLSGFYHPVRFDTVNPFEDLARRKCTSDNSSKTESVETFLRRDGN